MSRIKTQILSKLKEYASKMGTNTMGGDDYTSKKKGGLRDFDGYDNVDYNKDMPMDEGMFSTIDQIRQDSKNVRDFVKKVFADRDFKDMKNDKDFLKYLKSIYEGVQENIEEALPQNWMQGRTSDYHTKLRGKKREYDDTNFDKENSGQEDLEEAGFDKLEHLKLLNKAMRAMPGSPKQKDIIRKLNVVRKAGGMRPLKEAGYSLSDLIGQVKTFDKPKTQKLLTIMVINKLKQKRNNSKSKSNKVKIQKLIDKIEGDYKRGKYLKEYGQRLDLSYLEDEEARLKGTPKSKDAINRDIDETAKRDYKAEYKKFQSSTKSKKYRAELNKYNRQKGTYGNGDGKDASHKGGKIVGFESASKNRGRKEKSRLKKK